MYRVPDFLRFASAAGRPTMGCTTPMYGLTESRLIKLRFETRLLTLLVGLNTWSRTYEWVRTLPNLWIRPQIRPPFDVPGRTGEENGMSEHLAEHRASIEEWSYTMNGTRHSHPVLSRLSRRERRRDQSNVGSRARSTKAFSGVQLTAHFLPSIMLVLLCSRSAEYLHPCF